MAEPRKVPFVTISTLNTSPPTPETSKKRRREDEAVDITFGKDGGGSAVGSGGGGGLFGNAKGSDAQSAEKKPTVRLNLTLSEPNERGSSEFNYGELVQSSVSQVRIAKPGTVVLTGGLTWRTSSSAEPALMSHLLLLLLFVIVAFVGGGLEKSSPH